MSLRVLELDILHLSNPDHRLKLSVTSAADIRIPSCISSLEEAALVKAVISRSLWVSRGAACHFDIQVHFNGKPLDREGSVNFLESIGSRISDAQFWSLLSLSASLDIWQHDGIVSSPDLSINIKHGMEIPIQQTRHRAWDLDTFDIKPPDSVLCAEFERLHIRFDLSEIRKKAKRVTIDEPVLADDEVEGVMLLDFGVGSNPLASMDELIHTVEIMGDLPSIIEQCFQPLPGFVDDPALLQQADAQLLHQDRVSSPSSTEQDTSKSNVKNDRRKSRRHPQAAIEILNAWVQAHADQPHPSTDEKLKLARKTGLSKIQIKNWFDWKRRRLSKTNVSDNEVLLKWVENDRSAQDDEYEEEDNMLPSQGMENTPSLTSQSSIASSIPSLVEEERPLKRPFPIDELPDKSPACDLGEVAIQALVSGQIGRGLRGLSGIHVEKPPPSMSLSSLAPLTFCPGFKESMAQNAHFLPTISHAISVSWPRNIQSPTLRAKLSRLANSYTSSLTNATRIEDGEAGTTVRLASVVQSRLWAMMQRKLFDPSDAAKIWRKSTPQESTAEDDDYPELLETFDERNGMGDRVSTRIDDFEYEEDEFEDLLSADDDDLLAYMEERERLSVERETEEMLLGSGWEENPEHDGDMCLLDGDAGDDPMLL